MNWRCGRSVRSCSCNSKREGVDRRKHGYVGAADGALLRRHTGCWSQCGATATLRRLPPPPLELAWVPVAPPLLSLPLRLPSRSDRRAGGQTKAAERADPSPANGRWGRIERPARERQVASAGGDHARRVTNLAFPHAVCVTINRGCRMANR